MAKSLKKTATQAATKGAEGVKSVAAEALTVGAVAAAGVVVSRVAEALGSGSKKVEEFRSRRSNRDTQSNAGRTQKR